MRSFGGIAPHLLTAALVLAVGAQPLPEDELAARLSGVLERSDRAYREGRLDDAVRELEEAVRLRPQLAEAHAKLGVIHLSRQRYGQAAGAFREALRHKPSLHRAAALLGVAEVRSGRLAEAIPQLEGAVRELLDEDLGKQAGLVLLEAYHKLGQLDRASQLAGRLLEHHPDDVELLYSAYRLYSDLGSRAVARLTRAAVGSARLHQVTAELLEAQGDYVQAVDQYRRAFAKDPTLPGIRRALAVALLNAAQGEKPRAEARAELLAELRANPVDFHAIYELGEIEWAEGRFEQARARYAQAVELHPDFVDALIGLGKAATRAGDAEAARPHLERAVQLAPENEVARYRLAHAYRRLGRSEAAARELAQFERLRKEAAAIGEIYRQVLRKPVTGQTITGE